MRGCKESRGLLGIISGRSVQTLHWAVSRSVSEWWAPELAVMEVVSRLRK